MSLLLLSSIEKLCDEKSEKNQLQQSLRCCAVWAWKCQIAGVQGYLSKGEPKLQLYSLNSSTNCIRIGDYDDKIHKSWFYRKNYLFQLEFQSKLEEQT